MSYKSSLSDRKFGADGENKRPNLRVFDTSVFLEASKTGTQQRVEEPSMKKDTFPMPDLLI